MLAAGRPAAGTATALAWPAEGVRKLDRLAAYRAQDAARLGAVMTDLVAVFLAHHLDAADAVPPESRQQALMVSIRSLIEGNLGDAQLSPAAVAAAHHISVRTCTRCSSSRASPSAPGAAPKPWTQMSSPRHPSRWHRASNSGV